MWLDILFGIFTPVLAVELYMLFYFIGEDKKSQQFATVQMHTALIHRLIHSVNNY